MRLYLANSQGCPRGVEEVEGGLYEHERAACNASTSIGLFCTSIGLFCRMTGSVLAYKQPGVPWGGGGGLYEY